MPLEPGSRLDAFELVALLGRGGMGEVWLAIDTTLGRQVAVKLLPAEFTGDPLRVSRFEREARLASSLTHPNICHIYALGHATGEQRYIAMEYVEGRTLRAQLLDRRFGIRPAIDICAQIASGVSAAHAAGVIHRDLKPENVVIRPDGLVKVLDFGLAKLLPIAASRAAGASTQTAVASDAGSVVGTVAYMSPEQARGQDVDGRTDIWSVGVIAYELIAGRHPFAAPSTSDALAAILQREPDPLIRLDASVPQELERIVRKALQKDRDERYQVAKDLALDLKALHTALTSAGSGTSDLPSPTAPSDPRDRADPSRRRRTLVSFAAVGLLLVATAALALWWRTRPATSGQPASGAVSPAIAETYSQRRLTFGEGLQTDPALSPDGRFLAYSSDKAGQYDIWVQPVDGDSDPVRVTRSEAHDTEPAWSPDGNTLVFRSERKGGGLFLVPAFGGAERQLTTFGHRPWWASNGSEVRFLVGLLEMSRDSGSTPSLYTVPLGGGQPRELLSGFLRGGSWLWIDDHPDGRISALGLHATRGPGFYTVSSDGRDIVQSNRLPLGSPPAHPKRFEWAAGGSILFVEAVSNSVRSVWKVAVKPGSVQLLSAERLTTAADLDVGVTASSRGDRAAFSRQRELTRVWTFPLDAAAGRLTGPGQPVTEADGIAEAPAFSPDGRKLAFVFGWPGTERTELRSLDIATGVTELVAINAHGPCWSADSAGLWYHYIHFDKQPLEFALAYRRLGGPERLVTDWGRSYTFIPADSTPDRILGVFEKPDGSNAIARWSPFSERPAAPEKVLLSAPNASMWQAKYSPDRRWISFVLNDLAHPGNLRLTVAPAEGAPPDAWTRIAADHEWPDKPRWGPDGKLLFFLSRKSGPYFDVWAVRFDRDRGRPLGEPFLLTHFDSPGQRISSYIDNNELSISSRQLAVPITTATGSIWLLEAVSK
jgi:serine/threonine protein kinase